jgi:predicted RNase H-like HicB family nuclease
MLMTFHVEFDHEEDGRWIAEIPKCPGALAYGATKEEAVANAESIALDAIAEGSQ